MNENESIEKYIEWIPAGELEPSDLVMYPKVKDNSYKLFIDHDIINDNIFLGSRTMIITLLSLIDYCDKLKINGTDVFYNNWEDVIHPETTLYKALTYNGFEEKYIEGLNVDIIR